MEKKNRRVSCVLPVLSDYTAKGTSYVYSHLVITRPPPPHPPAACTLGGRDRREGDHWINVKGGTRISSTLMFRNEITEIWWKAESFLHRPTRPNLPRSPAPTSQSLTCKQRIEANNRRAKKRRAFIGGTRVVTSE
jgi:hypothetical protein